MQRRRSIHTLFESGEFIFRRLTISGILNDAVLDMNDPAMADEEISLFHAGVSSGDDYLNELHAFVSVAITERRAAPVVRFADGEYAFYSLSLRCNGLYRQAESVRSIRKAMPLHLDALRLLTRKGKIALLVFPGNLHAPRKWPAFRKSEGGSGPFLDLLIRNGIELNRSNYVPFYTIYAYLTSPLFSHLIDRRKLCIIGSEYNKTACDDWFARHCCRPAVSFVKIPDSYVATQWPDYEKYVLAQIPRDTDICLIGAGIGALPAAVGISRVFSIPAIDAGHVLNMMNGRPDKSNGARLYTRSF